MTKENRKKKMDRDGIKLQTISRVFALVGLILLISIAWNLRTVVLYYNDLLVEFDLHMNSHQYITALQNGSDDMTEQCRLFVVTKDPACLLKYFEIVDTDVREDARYGLVSKLEDTDYDQSIKMLNRALRESDDLMDSEKHAMKLVVLATGTEDRLIPQQIKTYQLPDGEESWSKEQKLQNATELVFGKNYRDKKNKIDLDIQAATTSMSDKIENEASSGINSMGPLIHRLIALCLLMGMQLILLFFLIRALVIRPLMTSIDSIQKDQGMTPRGSAEFRYLASTYNTMFESNRDKRLRMNYMLEHDSLTDVNSRFAFDIQKKSLAESPVPIALLIYDIDHFKQVNDTFGHDAGDRALVRVATTSKNLLRHDDLVFRIGGDEFAVVLMNVYPYSRSMIEEKLQLLNERLQHPNDGSPKLSLSIGVAFSDHGYSEDLFHQADRALYEAKAAGRHCCRFGEDLPPETPETAGRVATALRADHDTNEEW